MYNDYYLQLIYQEDIKINSNLNTIIQNQTLIKTEIENLNTRIDTTNNVVAGILMIVMLIILYLFVTRSLKC